MRVIDQSYQIKLLADFGPQSELIEDCGRVAYQSEDLINEESAPKFVKMIRGRNHGAVLEHSMMTVKFITDRGVSHELVRHRLASFTQESTRYCNYSKGKFGGHVTFIRPSWMTDDKYLGEFDVEKCSDMGCYKIGDEQTPENLWMVGCLTAEDTYLSLLRKEWTPQQARSVLPNSLKTQIAVTANLREWLHIFQLRAIEKAAHPQMRALMIPLYQECRQRAPHLFDLGDPE